MPFAVYLLGLAVFAQGTSEFMLSGLIPGIARDLRVSIPAAGLLTSAFAVGMVVGAPLMAVLSLRWSRRFALLAFLVTFLVVHVVGALTTSYGVLLGTRVIAALANAGFLAVAMATAVALAPSDAKGRATSVLLGGVTIACVAGVPGGALLGEVWGWRSAFWAVAVALVPAIVAVLKSVPSGPAGGGDGGAGPAGARARGELRALRRPRLLVLLALAALVNGGTFCTFTYLAPLLTGDTGIGSSWMPLMLALFGLGSFAGVTASGRVADRRPTRLLVICGPALAAGWAVFALAAGAPVPAVVLVFVQGTLSFAVGSTLISQVLYAATGAPTLAGGFATAALNVGATLGPWLGGLTIGAGLGLRSPLWVSALLVAAALVTAAVARAVGVNPVEKGQPAVAQ
ncbi:Cmx/CmrA family chloramphenicol efflux MFS transporter [Nonomuraea jabiensis]|uniref:DHA1 family chloramphenicol resistance protein-like MFS transporter n=1 Tax=Nonomuraea jabiensis TaxID=882448 RepID=A0A7W9G0C3_9ACTN|nr:Cmx/CmrA family chloramphenicol efflux MFS transporter [Nonomuraea jabiensis]MBB5774889.1 DHA1 family chloramphenicol resistance protein-like MFS transporter [Nonomuraea jabiensis]